MKVLMPPKRIITPRRAISLRGVDDDISYGPRPIDVQDVPIDLQPRVIKNDQAGGAGAGVAGGDLSGLVSQIANDVHSLAGVITLSNSLLGRVVQLTGTPKLIVNPQYDRAYLFLNPSGVTGLTSVGTLLSSTTLVGATTLTTGSIGVANYKTGRFWVESVFGGGAGPVTFDLQTKNPVTGNFITSQTIFTLTATGNAYANVGTLGIDTDAQIFITVPGGTTITFSLGFCLKDGLAGTTAGSSQTIYIGGAGVSAASGYPILNGAEKQFWIKQNSYIYGVTNGPTLNMNVFEL